LIVQLGTPVLGIFIDNLITSATTLGVVVVGRDGNDILGIDLNDHGVTPTGIAEVREILDRTEVQTIGASPILVLVNLVARHLTNLANRVVKGSAMNVLEVCSDILVSKEVTICCDGKFPSLKEIVKLVDCTIGRVLHKVLKELNQGQERQSVTHEVDDTGGDGVVNGFILVKKDSILDLNIPRHIGIDRSRNVCKGGNLVPVLHLDCLKDAGIVGMVGVDGKRLSIDDCGDLSRSRDGDCDVVGGVHSVKDNTG
jgi:hypothetical protein